MSNQNEESATDTILGTFTNALLAEQRAMEDISLYQREMFDYLREVMIAVTVLISEVRRESLSQTAEGALGEIRTGIGKITDLLENGKDD